MPRRYFLYPTNSDITATGATYNKYLLPNLIGGPSASIQAVTVNGGANVTASSFTYQLHPGDHALTGSYTASLTISTAGSTINLSTRWHRVNSAGTIQTSTTSSVEQTIGTATTYVFNWGAVNLGTFANNDRVRLDYMFRNTNAMTAQTPAFQYNQTGSFVVLEAYGRKHSTN